MQYIKLLFVAVLFLSSCMSYSQETGNEKTIDRKTLSDYHKLFPVIENLILESNIEGLWAIADNDLKQNTTIENFKTTIDLINSYFKNKGYKTFEAYSNAGKNNEENLGKVVFQGLE